MIKTLIIDDDKLICLLHKKIIIRSKIDLNPLVFLQAKLALEYLIEKLPIKGPFLILLDINMKEMNAWEFLNRLKLLDQDKMCKVVLVTSSISLEDKKKANESGMVIDFIEKPLLMDHCENLKKKEYLEPLFD